MSGRMTRVALIGAGMMAGRYHHPSLASFSDVELVGISDLIVPKAMAAAASLGIEPTRVYSDYREMISTLEPDAVYVLMPPQVLYEPAFYALTHGCHVFVEKPLGLTVTQARMLAYTAEEQGRLSMVGFQRRFSPSITAFRERVEQRGPIHTASVTFHKSTGDLSRPTTFYDGAIDPLTSDGIHAVDTLRWLCGGEVEEVHLIGRRRFVPGTIANAYNALIGFSSGAVGTLSYNLVTGNRIFRVEMHGQNTTAVVDPDRDSLFVADDAEPVTLSSETFGEAALSPGEVLEPYHWLGFWHESRHFIDSIVSGTQPSSHFGDAVKTMELVQRLHELT
jgi:virulence factor